MERDHQHWETDRAADPDWTVLTEPPQEDGLREREEEFPTQPRLLSAEGLAHLVGDRGLLGLGRKAVSSSVGGSNGHDHPPTLTRKEVQQMLDHAGVAVRHTERVDSTGKSWISDRYFAFKP